MSNPSFPVGDRRVEDPQKDLPVRVAPRAHLGTGPASLPMVVSHASSQHSEMLKSYQVSMVSTCTEWRSQYAEKVTHTKGRLLDQVMILFIGVPFQNGNFS